MHLGGLKAKLLIICLSCAAVLLFGISMLGTLFPTVTFDMDQQIEAKARIQKRKK